MSFLLSYPQSEEENLQQKFNLKLDAQDVGELGYEESDPSEKDKKEKSASDSGDSDDYGKDVVSQIYL